MSENRKITPNELYEIIIGFQNGTTVECPRHCTGCNLENVCEDITHLVSKLIDEED